MFYPTVSGYTPRPGYNPYKLHPKDPERETDEPPGFWARMTTAWNYQKGTSVGARKEEKKLWAVFVFLLLTNLPAALYTSLVHQVLLCSLDVCPVLLISLCPVGVADSTTTNFCLLLKLYREEVKQWWNIWLPKLKQGGLSVCCFSFPAMELLTILHCTRIFQCVSWTALPGTWLFPFLYRFVSSLL